MNIISASIKSSAPAASATRRSFMRYLTVGVAALAVEGCGGGAGTGATVPAAPSPAAPVTPVAPASAAPVVAAPAAPVDPVWLSIPTIAFTQGTPSSFSVADYITAANVQAFTMILNSSPLPAGVTFNGATRAFDYDGQGAPAATEGHVLTAIGA